MTFDSRGSQLTGILERPAESTGKLPAVFVTGSWMTVKEQMPAVYARRLAEAGYAALSFDFRGFGESAGAPRDVESARLKAEDLQAAVTFLRSRPDLDAARVGGLAVCASAGYAVLAAQQEPRPKSLVMVAPWLHDRSIVEAIYGGAEGVAERKRNAERARERYEQTGTVEYCTAASNRDPNAAMYWEGDALDYYLNPKRGAIPEWSNRFAVMAWTEWLDFDPIALAPQHRVPTRLVSGEGTATPGGAQRFAAALAVPHDLVLLPGSQFDFYDDPATVAAAVSAAVQHFQGTL